MARGSGISKKQSQEFAQCLVFLAVGLCCFICAFGYSMITLLAWILSSSSKTAPVRAPDLAVPPEVDAVVHQTIQTAEPSVYQTLPPSPPSPPSPTSSSFGFSFATAAWIIALVAVNVQCPHLIPAIVGTVTGWIRRAVGAGPPARRPIPNVNLDLGETTFDDHVVRIADQARQRVETPRAPDNVMDFLFEATNLMDSIWELFFSQCFEVGSQLKASGKLTNDDLEAVDPWLVLGLPAVVISKVALRSVARDPSTITLSNGQVVTEASRPRYAPGAQLWEPLIELNQAIDALSLTPAEAEFFSLVCFRAGHASDKDARPSSVAKGSSRERDITRVVSLAVGIAIEISRLRRFADHLQGCLDLLIDAESA